MSREEVTKIATDGLRYKSKKSGTPFGGSSAMGTMSRRIVCCYGQKNTHTPVQEFMDSARRMY